MKLAGVIIGLNQDLHLEAALKSLKGCDEVVLADHGSTDRSLDITRACGARVLNIPAGLAGGGPIRNWVQEQLDADYVVWLAADEALNDVGVRVIRLIIEKSDRPLDAIIVNIREHDGSRVHPFHKVTRRGIPWAGKVHEYPDLPPTPVVAVLDGKSPMQITITHTAGPWHANPSDPYGVRRLLEEEMRRDPGEPRWLYFYAREWYNRGDFRHAMMWFEKRLEMSGTPAEWADTALYLARIYWASGRAEDARVMCLRAIAKNPCFREAILLMAQMSGCEEHKRQWLHMAETANNRGVFLVRHFQPAKKASA